jgi:carbon monoxide dehydrogenase subunit G
MKMAGEQRISAGRERVWQALQDPAVLKACIPGCQSLEAEDDGRMRAVVAIKIGPINAKFTGAVALTEQDPPSSCVITGEGQGGAAGVAKGQARVRLDEEAGATRLAYEVDAQVGGKLAQVGGALIDATARRLAGSFFDRFGELVQTPGAEPSQAAEPVRASEPAQAAMAPAAAIPAAPSSAAAGSGWRSAAWLLSVALALLVGFLAGRGQAGSSGSDWTGVAIGLLLLVVGAGGFWAGRGAGAPSVVLDAREVARLLRERDR